MYSYDETIEAAGNAEFAVPLDTARPTSLYCTYIMVMRERSTEKRIDAALMVGFESAVRKTCRGCGNIRERSRLWDLG